LKRRVKIDDTSIELKGSPIVRNLIIDSDAPKAPVADPINLDPSS
jgi:hypothetical protein